MKIISGGQIGADIAGLRAAKKMGFETGGWMPRGFRTLEGNHPEYAELYGVKESSDGGYPQRTRLNVMMSHATLRFAIDWNSPGERLTRRICEELKRPFLDITVPTSSFGILPMGNASDISNWLLKYNVEILNIAGNAKKELEEPVEQFLVNVFEKML